MVHDARGAWVSLPVSGVHQVTNALAASAAGLSMGFSLDECSVGLEKSQVSPYRMQIEEAGGVIFVNDAYNASPQSVASAIETSSRIVTPGSRLVLVMGQMAELGPIERAEHLRVGTLAASVAQRLITVGPEAAGIAEGARAAGMTDVHEVLDERDAIALLDDLRSGDVVLVKASRVVGLESLVGRAIAAREERVP
jgi:UDP-N-acetylmuramoyl-tripeptide--D-alanyl-D-alanine ligase